MKFVVTSMMARMVLAGFVQIIADIVILENKPKNMCVISKQERHLHMELGLVINAFQEK